MFQQRPGLIRCFLATALSLLGALAVACLPTAMAAPIASVVDRLPPITSTVPIDLALSNGSFIEAPKANLPGVQSGSANWGDCNNDSGSDVLFTGQVSATLRIARVYQQQMDGTFAQPAEAEFSGVMNGAAAWGDYDNDGWLDVALTGESITGPISQIWHNERNGASCAFSLVANLIGVRNSAGAWGDYNTDGQLDLILVGTDGTQLVTRIYRNDHGSFTDSGLSLPGIQNGAAAWGDYDNDGQADLLLTGTTVNDVPLTKIYHNDGHGVLIEVPTSLPALSDSAAAWGDYDNDGDLDLLLEGKTEAVPAVAALYRNEHGVFVKNVDADQLMGSLTWTGAAWGDYDTDGYVDVLIGSDSFAKAYRNEITGSFATGIQVGPSLLNGTTAWGHYDTDYNLDILLTGLSGGGRITKIYKYSNFISSAPPDAPTNLSATIDGSDVVLHWSPPLTDDHTLLDGLSYNLRIGTQPGGIDIIAPMAIVTTNLTIDGYRLLPALGNVYQARSVTLTNLSLGQKYYWSVQAIDTSYLGSNFAEERDFQIPHRVFLPVLLKDFVSVYTSDWETEPNNTYLQANGALESGHTYQGQHNDARDYYSVYLSEGGTISVDMGSSNGGTQIHLFYQVADVAHRLGYDPAPPYHLGFNNQPAGWYYVMVFTDEHYYTQTYTMTVTYP
jgi:hypothetical protein